MENFFGVTHKKLHKEILSQIKAIQDGDMSVPRIIILQGESGVGKSKIIREVYESMRAEVMDGYPQYWPDLSEQLHISSNTGIIDPLAERKILGPTERITFTKQVNAVPTFNWIPLKFESGSLDYTNSACADILSAIETHKIALSVGLRLTQTKMQKFVEEISKTAEYVRPKSREDYAGGVVEVATLIGAVAIPGVGYAVSAASSLGDRIQARSEAKKFNRESIHVGLSQDALVKESDKAATAVRQSTSPKFPAIIAIEDLQWMDDELPILIKQLASKVEDRPVIVLGTMWPFSETSQGAEDEVKSWVDNEIAQILQVPPLESEELLKIIDQIAPATAMSTKYSLVKRWNNPYRLKLFLTWSQIVQRMSKTDEGLKLEISDAELDTYPIELEAMYQARWESLDDEVKIALAAAAAAIPADKPNHAFVIEVIAKAIARQPDALRWPENEEHRLATEELILDYYSVAMATSWLQETEIAEVFRETFLAEIAMKAIAELIDSADGNLLRTAVAQQLYITLEEEIGSRSWLDMSDPDNDKTKFLAIWLLGLMEDGQIRQSLSLNNLDLFLQLTRAQLLSLAWNFRGACEALPDSLTSVAGFTKFVIDPETFSAAIQIVQWLGDSGDVELARDVCLKLRLKSNELDGIPLELIIETEIALANWTGNCKKREEAIEMYDDLANRYLDSDSLSVIQSIKINIGQALWAVESGNGSRALELYERAIGPSEKALGPNHHLTLEARRGYARSFGEVKKYDKAIEVYQEIYNDCLREFGANGLETVEAHRGLARWKLENGNVAEANSLYAEVFEISKTSFGSDHYLTLWAYVGVVKASIKSGDLDRADKNLRELKKRKNVVDSSHNIHVIVADLEVELQRSTDLKAAEE